MKIQTNLITDAHIRERVETACAAAERMGRTFVAATFRVIAEQELVKITIPSVSAKYLKKVEAHSLLVFIDEALESALPIDIREHSIHGDFPIKRADNTQRPRVVRHFYVLPGYYGETISAYVTLKEKTDLISGEKTIMVDIQQQFSEEPLTVSHKLSMGVPVTGAKGEAIIPGADNLCIRFEKIHPLVIEAQNSDINLLPANNQATPAETTPPKATTESVAA